METKSPTVTYNYPVILKDLRESSNRFTLFPIQYQNLWSMYKTHASVIWIPEEVDLTHDVEDWKKLSKEEQEFIEIIIAFFAASDGIVNFNIGCRFSQQIEIPEICAFYTIQSYMETVHSETYSLLIETLIKDSSKKDFYFNAIENIPSIKRKADFALKYMRDAPLEECLIAFAFVEGVMFSSSFCGLFYLKSKNKGMPGLMTSNSYISRDENLHSSFAVEVYKTFTNNGQLNRLPVSKVHSIAKEAMECEEAFCKECLRTDLVGMNSNAMINYVKTVCDRLLSQLQYDKLYPDTSHDFDWMCMIGVDEKSNFFEQKVTQYSSSKAVMKFSVNDEF
tara:strand:+ start:1476 stop:2483 length:1008 start_codon:yes stop_codon:yes gene_type:complete